MVDRLQKLSFPLGAFFPDRPMVDLPAANAAPCGVAQFSVRCEGGAEYPEDLTIYGTFQVETVVDFGTFDSLNRAMAVIEDRTARDDIESGCEDAVSFSPRLFIISDDGGRLVLTGEVRGDTVKWCVPVVSDEEAEQVASKAKALRAEAAFEQGWDNYSTAKLLRSEASILEGRLVDPLWRKAARAALPATADR